MGSMLPHIAAPWILWGLTKWVVRHQVRHASCLATWQFGFPTLLISGLEDRQPQEGRGDIHLARLEVLHQLIHGAATLEGVLPWRWPSYHLVIQQFAMENDPFIDGLPITRWYCNQRSTDLRDIHGYPTDYCIKKWSFEVMRPISCSDTRLRFNAIYYSGNVEHLGAFSKGDYVGRSPGTSFNPMGNPWTRRRFERKSSNSTGHCPLSCVVYRILTGWWLT